MAIGTIFTLFVVLSVYVLIAKDHRKERALRTEIGPGSLEGDLALPARVSAEELPTETA